MICYYGYAYEGNNSSEEYQWFFVKLYCIEFHVYEEELLASVCLFGEYVKHYIPRGVIDLTDYTKTILKDLLNYTTTCMCMSVVL